MAARNPFRTTSAVQGMKLLFPNSTGSIVWDEANKEPEVVKD
jgi:hypothetical protein